METVSLEQIAEHAQWAFANGYYSESLTLFDALISRGMRDEEVLLGRAISLLELGAADAAEKAFLLTLYHFSECATAIDYLKECGAAYTRPLVWLNAKTQLPAQVKRLSIEDAQKDEEPRPWFSLSSVDCLGPLGLLLDRDLNVLHSFDGDKSIYLSMARKTVPLHQMLSWERRQLPGRYLSLLGHWTDAFYHWMVESLPMAIRAEQEGLGCTYIIHSQPKFIRESLLFIGIPPERIFEWDDIPSCIEELILPPHLPSSFCEGYPARLVAIRHAFRSRIEVNEGRRERLYLKRTNPDRPRRVINSEELESMLESFDFKTVDLDQIPFVEQIKLLSHAEAVVTPHGAAMVHTLFMHERSLVIELFGLNYVNPCMMQTMLLLKHRYHMVPSYRNHGAVVEINDDIQASVTPVQIAVNTWQADQESRGIIKPSMLQQTSQRHADR